MSQRTLQTEFSADLRLLFQLNFWNFAVLFVVSAVALNYWIRFRYLNDYTQLKEPPLVKPDVNELHPDVNTGEYLRIISNINIKLFP
jgi:lysophospholipid hydrolase